jgi:tetratricopeptide (TPR) repeat protein
MCSDPTQPGHGEALALWEDGSRRQMERDLEGAERLYRWSIELHPTSEAWTFLGWVASWRGNVEEAITCCQRAIEVDPTFGNPYNDIGAYLIELERMEEAVPWLQRTLEAPRYEARIYPWVNLGRVYERLGRFKQAIEHYRKALEIEPRYRPALDALDRLLILLIRRNGYQKPR